MSTDQKFMGWCALDSNSVKGELKYQEYQPKTWDETDIEVKIHFCGVCASDLHTISGGWGTVNYPQVVGHEICGEVVRVGSQVTGFKIGDFAGWGAQCDNGCDGTCSQCSIGRVQYCDKGQVGTYNGIFKKGNAKGDKSYGGYAEYARAPAAFAVKIPAGLDPALAAPMLCGGVTVYSPLKQYGAGTTAKDVGIIGIGGLGHFGLLFAKAMGANVTAISHSESKKEDAMKMGATTFIATHGDDKNAFKPYKRSLDLIICTTNDTNMPIVEYLSLLKPGGNLILVGAPEAPLKELPLFALIMNNVHIGGSAIGSPAMIKEMLELAATQKIHPWIIKKPMSEVNDVIVKMHKEGAKYRYVLVNQANGGKL